MEALTTYDQYGYSLRLNRQANISSAGWTEPEPSQSQGVLSFGYGGVTALLRWIPAEGVTSEAMLVDSYNILSNAQPGLRFTPVNEGRITVSSEPGAFGSFAAADAAGAILGGGVIGSWFCPVSTTAFALTVTGPKATTLQIRFQRLLDSFSCPS